MRFNEFKTIRNKELDEFLPALATGARAVGGAVASGAKAVGGVVAKGAQAVGSAIKQGAQTVGGVAANAAGQAVGQAVGQAATNAAQGQQAQQQQIELKPGMNITSVPQLGQTKVKTIQGKNAVLDTQKTLGLDVTVDKDQLLATLGQNQNAAPGTAAKPGALKTLAQGIQKGPQATSGLR